jgi:hypothetical protein
LPPVTSATEFLISIGVIPSRLISNHGMFIPT